MSSDERQELIRLRAQVAALSASARSAGTAATGRGGRIWRWTASGVLLLLMAVMAMAAVAARYVHAELLDTDKYVQTVAPIGEDPAVKAQIVDTVTTAIDQQLDVEGHTRDLLTSLAQSADRLPPRVADQLPGLAPMIANAAENLVNKEVTKAVDSPQFETLWVNANKVVHKNLVSVLTGEGSTAITADTNGNVELNLEPVIAQVKRALVNDGLTFADSIPAVDKSITIVQSDKVVKLQRLVRLLDGLAAALPWLAVVSGIAAVWAAPKGRRWRAGTIAGGALAVAMVLLGLGVNVGRSIYLNAVPSDVLTPSAAAAIIDPLLEPLRLMLRAFLVLGLVAAVVCFLAGGSRSAVFVRHQVATFVGWVRGRNRQPTAFEVWMGRLRPVLVSVVIAAGVLVLATWRYPSGSTVLWIAIITAFAAFIVYAVGVRPEVAAEAKRDVAAETRTEAASEGRLGM